MSGPKKQHFIPRTYLKNFSDEKEEKYFSQVMNIHSGKITPDFSISNLCVSKNIYTIPDVDDKFALEKWYATHIDAVYPEVYRLLIDDSVLKIDEQQRQKILNTCLSLYFRTPAFLDQANEELEQQINRLKEMATQHPDAELLLGFGGKQYRFKKEEIESVRQEAILQNKTNFIVNHLYDWQQFVTFKSPAQIAVSRVDDINLITCDNPVMIRNSKNTHGGLFDANNGINLPLDSHHLLWISPQGDWGRHTILRGNMGKEFGLVSNHSIHKNASKWIIGKNGDIDKHLADQKSFNEGTTEKDMADFRHVVTEMTKLVAVIEKEGFSPFVIGKLKEFLHDARFRKDKTFMELIKSLGTKRENT